MKDFTEPLATVQDEWNANSKEWVKQVRAGQDVYRNEFLEPAFMKFLGDIAGLEVLDGACGEGTSSRTLARAGARVTGIDLSQNMIISAQQLEAAQPLGISYIQGSASETPFEDASFDLVTVWMALNDISCQQSVLNECARVLRPGGKLAFCIRHPAFFTRRSGILRGTGANPSGVLIGDYFNKEPWTENWAFSGGADAAHGRKTFSNLRFPLSLADSINGVLEAGLMLRRIEEPVPEEEVCSRHPRLDFWRRHGALYLFVAAGKP